MFNQITILGKIKEIPSEKMIDNRLEKVLIMTTNRNYRNQDGGYDVDQIEVILWRGIAETISSIAAIDDIIHVVGRIENDSDGKFKLIAENVTFIN